VSSVRLESENPYSSAGIPAAERPWILEDYKRALKILSQNKIPLPRLDDKYGKAILMRLTSSDLFKVFQNRNTPVNLRLNACMDFGDTYNSIYKLYGTTLTNDHSYHSEFAALLAFFLKFAAVEAEVVEDFLPTLPKDDRYEVRVQGLNQMFRGAEGMFSAAEASLADTVFYSDSDFSLIIKAMAEILPQVLKHSSENFNSDMKSKLEVDKTRFKDSSDQKTLNQMLDVLNHPA